MRTSIYYADIGFGNIYKHHTIMSTTTQDNTNQTYDTNGMRQERILQQMLISRHCYKS